VNPTLNINDLMPSADGTNDEADHTNSRINSSQKGKIMEDSKIRNLLCIIYYTLGLPMLRTA